MAAVITKEPTVVSAWWSKPQFPAKNEWTHSTQSYQLSWIVIRLSKLWLTMQPLQMNFFDSNLYYVID